MPGGGNRAFGVDSPPNSPYGTPAGTGRSAAYGFGLLLTGFAPGNHVIQSHWSIGSAKWNVTFTVNAS